MEFICRNCGRKHEMDESLIDDIIECGCGYQFFAFENRGMSVMIPMSDFRTGLTMNLFRLLVISTGRFPDAAAEALDCAGLLNKVGPLRLIQEGLDRVQEKGPGKCRLTAGDVITICDLVKKHKDVLVKNKGRRIDVCELQMKTRNGTEGGIPGEPGLLLGEEADLKDWQKDIMEQDQTRERNLFRKKRINGTTWTETVHKHADELNNMKTVR